ncbi:NADH--cytochrome b5 reductase 1 [Vitis vinifera]|uniref:cytochrome-b5 reductase n=1 Tax=Vitis vinifera TaxID=29760 RepID=A0A438DN53_VITVI|nr:NADH--cytochrome b5 reductase 1 [Vitis vinifera]RVW93970.1 NADH--cytochrome b5 reductase 1 [Vitis vinifera]
MWKMTSALLPTFRVTWPLKTPGIELSGFAVGLAAVGLAAVYFFYGRRKPKGCLDPERFQDFKLVRKTRISHNVGRFRFALPTPTSVFGLPVGQHIICRGKDDQGAEVIRPYTPITLDSDVGFFELVVKMYPKGQMSHHFRKMREGDTLAVKGPRVHAIPVEKDNMSNLTHNHQPSSPLLIVGSYFKGHPTLWSALKLHFVHLGRLIYKPGQAKAFGMLAGGTGITPMFQLTRAILENPKDKTNVHLIYANVSYDDILLKES